ncbi:amidohydrolase family protein [Elioraea thermophila]|uniref:amidohydrolase family protein n=1 Tax=Elioraea thermophila TaxID=2185104 RepID=UPI000DF16173|nr:amidohydrolase family protein [Elioraea thermophila]
MADRTASGTTLIRNAEVVVAWDAAARRHVYLDGGDVAFADGTLRHVGRGYAGPAERVIDGAGLMVMPGLVNIHSHPSSEPKNKGITDEIGSPALYHSTLYEYLPALVIDEAGAKAAARVALAELALSGVTTVVDLSVAYDGWLDLLAESGLRAVVAPMVRSARWFTRNGHVVEYEWDEATGERALVTSLSLIERACQHPSGRLSGMVAPAQIDTCTPHLIRDSFAEAKRRGLAWQIHAAQSVVEFHEITRRHGVTPIQWLAELDVLSDRSIVGHGIFLDDHPRTRWWTDRDLALLAETGTTVAHCPTVFLRRGIALRDFGRYRRAGVRLGLGTDTFPHNMLEEMRHAAYVARLVAETPRTLSTADVFEAATVAGAAALGRDDIGRLAPGCRADLVLVDLRHPAMRPVRDPLRSLVYSAAERAVRSVFVDGEEIVREGRMLTIDLEAAAAELEAAQARMLARVPERDRARRPIDALAPAVLPHA